MPVGVVVAHCVEAKNEPEVDLDGGWAARRTLELVDGPGLPADGQVDDDAVGVETLGSDAGLEARGRRLNPEVVPFPQLLAEAAQQGSIRPHHQDFMINFRFEISQGHAMLLEEPKQMLAWDS